MSVTVENNKMISKLLDLANGDEYIFRKIGEVYDKKV